MPPEPSSTDALIDTLVRASAPVARARPLMERAIGWLILAGTVIGATVAVDGVCPNLPLRAADPLYAAGLGAAGLTGALSVVAAFLLGLPDRSRLWGLLPLPAAGLWVAAVVGDCLALPPPMLSSLAAPAPPEGYSSHCACVFLLLSLVLALLLRWGTRDDPLRHGWGTSGFAGLAVAGLATAGLSLTRTFAAPGPLLTWNLGAGALAALLLAALWRWGERPPRKHCHVNI